MCSGSAGGVRGPDAGVRVPLAAHARLRQVPPRQRHVHHCPGKDDDDDDDDDNDDDADDDDDDDDVSRV